MSALAEAERPVRGGMLGRAFRFSDLRLLDHVDLPLGPKALLTLLLRDARSGVCDRSVASCARALGCSVRSVQRYFAVLRGGLVDRVPRFVRGEQVRSLTVINLALLRQVSGLGRAAVKLACEAAAVLRAASRASRFRARSSAFAGGGDSLSANNGKEGFEDRFVRKRLRPLPLVATLSAADEAAKASLDAIWRSLR